MNENQQRAAAHNWMRGRVAMARAAIFNIIASDTATDEAKAAAQRIDTEIHDLLVMLKVRSDQ